MVEKLNRREIVEAITSVAGLLTAGGVSATKKRGGNFSDQTQRNEIIDWYRKYGEPTSTTIERPFSRENGKISVVLNFPRGISKKIVFTVVEESIETVSLSGNVYDMNRSETEINTVDRRLARGFANNDREVMMCLQDTEFGGGQNE